MKFFIKIKWLIFIVILLGLKNTFAIGIYNLYAVGKIKSHSQLSISTKFVINLPKELKYILTQGIPLYFDLTYDTSRSIFASYKLKFNRLFGNNYSVIKYKLTYHSLTNTYIVEIGSFYSEHKNLESALKLIGFTSNWLVNVNLENLFSNSTENFDISVKLSLSISKLPNPYQINAITLKRWDLNSHWVKVNIK